MTLQSLANQFLIAMPSMNDQNFYRTVTLLCQHDENGSLGVIINRRINDLSFTDILEHLGIAPDSMQEGWANPVYSGGPVHPELGMVLHEDAGTWESTIGIGEKLGLTTSMDIVQAIAAGHGPEKSLFVLGYAGWGSGQLEYEIQQNAWLCAPADPDIIFETPVDERWESAARQLGIDLNTMTTEAGHA